MAEDIVQNQLGMLGNMSQSATALVILIVAGIILVAILVGIVLSIKNAKRYKQYQVIIFQNDGFGHTSWRTDGGGIFVDGKTGNKRLFLKNSHVGLEPDNIPFIPTAKGERIVMLLQTSLKTYKYIKPIIDKDMIRFTVGEEDVNWAVNEFEAQKKRFNTNLLLQYMPFIILGISFMILAILMVSIFNKLPLIKDIAVQMKEVAQLLVQARSGTTIIP
jgi:Ca2+/Na+ antiporter